MGEPRTAEQVLAYWYEATMAEEGAWNAVVTASCNPWSDQTRAICLAHEAAVRELRNAEAAARSFAATLPAAHPEEGA